MIESIKKIKSSEEKFKILFELSPIGMAMVNPENGKFLEVNQSLLNSIGYNKEELLALSFWEISSPKYKLLQAQEIENLHNHGNYSPKEKEFIKKDATKYPVKISGFTFIDINHKKVLWALIEDITEKKQYEIIYKDNKNLLEFIAIENNLQKILDKIVHLAEKRNPKIMCSILLLDKSKQHLLNGSAPSLPKSYSDAINGIKIGENVGSCGSAAFKKKRVIVENINTHGNWQDYLDLTKKANLHACWSEPIISSQNEVLGTFAVYNNEVKAPNSFMINLIETYSNIAAKAIEKHNYTTVIKERENQLELLFNNSQCGLLYISDKMELIKANQKFIDILGYSTYDEIVGLNIKDFHLSYEKFIEFEKYNFNSLINQKDFNIEYELRRKDGSSIWCELSGKTLDENNPADLSKGIIWTINDISLRKKYEEELKEKKLFLENILYTIPDMIWLKDKNGIYLRCNPEFERFFGKKENQIIGKTDYDFVDNELANFFRLNDQIAMQANDVVTNEEWVTYASNNKKVLLETSKKSMKNIDGEIVGILGLAHDITWRKERENELKKLNNLAESLTKSQQVLLSLFDKGDATLFKWINNKDLQIEYVSLSIFKLLGYSKEEFLSKNIEYSSYIHPDDLVKVINELKEALKENKEYFKHEPYRVITKDKIEKWVLHYTVTQKDNNEKITHFIAYITDITEQVHNQEMMYHQSKIASLGEMLGNISHQWRQPLSVISTTATGTRLKKELDILSDEEFYDNMKSINEHAQYLSETIDNFRDFSQVSDDSKKKVKLKDSLYKVFSLIRDPFKNSNIEIIENLDDEIYIVCNESIFIQAIINILNNAKDALNQINIVNFDKYVFITLEREKDFYSIKIKDNGKGIEKKSISKIFEPYFTTKYKSQGTGIGLYMTNQILEKHLNATIEAENIEYTYLNEKYKGALFQIKIPIDNTMN
jgi:PAS domain S-box-containing protein